MDSIVRPGSIPGEATIIVYDMSSYLNIKLIPEQENKKKEDISVKDYLLIGAWGRSSEIYQAFRETVSPVSAYTIKVDDAGHWMYNENGVLQYEDEIFTDLTSSELDAVLKYVNNNIESTKKSLDKISKDEAAISNYKQLIATSKDPEEATKLVEKLSSALDNIEDFDYTNELKEELEGLEYAKCIIVFLSDLYSSLEYTSFLGIVCNID